MKLRSFATGLWVLLLFVPALLLGTPAQAQTCSISFTPLIFGPVDVTTNAQVNSTATVTVACMGSALLPVGVCIELGPGLGGGTSASNRTMVNGAEQLSYGLFSDPSASVPWGSSAWPTGGASGVGFNLTLSASGTGSRSLTIYGRVYGGQATAAPVAYSSTFSGINARLRYGLLSFLLGCDLLTNSQSATFTVSATVPATCRIMTDDLAFGSMAALSSPQDAVASFAPVCTRGTPYQIGLDGGLSGAPNPTSRRMMKGSEFVTYGLYRNASRSLPLGNTIGVDTLPGIGSGLSQPSLIYGRVPAQSTPSPGVYTDTIQATVIY